MKGTTSSSCYISVYLKCEDVVVIIVKSKWHGMLDVVVIKVKCYWHRMADGANYLLMSIVPCTLWSVCWKEYSDGSP